MRIGELLLQRGLVDWESLVLALDDQLGTTVRLCSLLVARGVLGFDDAAKALGDQLGVAAVQRRHLEHRDRALANLLPIEVERAEVVMPLGRMRDGTLIIAARDPSRALHAKLARRLTDRFVLAVVPAHQLETLVDEVVTARVNEVDIDIDPGVSGELDVDLDAPDDAAAFEDLGDALVEEPEPAPAPPVSKNKPLPVDIKQVGWVVDRPAAADSIEGTIAALGDVDDVEWLFDVLKRCLARHWKTSRVLEIRDGEAQPSGLVRLALERRRLVHEIIADAHMATMLAHPIHPVAMPIIVGDRIPYVIVVGDPPKADPEEAAVELGMLGEAVAEALARLAPSEIAE